MTNSTRQRLLTFWAIAASLCILGCGSSGTSVENSSASISTPPPPYDYADPGLSARLDEALRLWAEDFGLYGAAAAVVTPGYFNWSGHTGVKDIDTQEPYTKDAFGRIASATKSFTATIIFQLIDEGRLSLDSKLAEFLPQYPNGENIKVEYLLRHRSGIPEIQLVDGVFIASVLLRPGRWISPQEIMWWTYRPAPFPPIYDIDTGKSVPRRPVGEPGGDFHYAQPNYIALGIIIEQVTGKQLADVYAERILKPLGLSHTHLPLPGEPLDPAGYTNLFGLLKDKKIPATDLVGNEANGLNSASWSAGGIVSSAQDLANFLATMLQGRLFSKASLKNATDWIKEGPDTDEEYGMGLSRVLFGQYTAIGHDGALPGSGSVMRYIPELDVYIGAVTNTDQDSVDRPSLVERVRRALLKEAQDESPLQRTYHPERHSSLPLH